ncbi:ABC transporter ATP-binding protein [Pseudoflavonifractor phocaeensis]|uniref:ABC transporter ATP-binding protein n=1 Tax=Pseudoflavonifractor phocaeensis TaxID=1870988 RepID=UPI00313AE79D
MPREEKEFDTSLDWKTWKGILPYLKPYRRELGRVFLCNLLCALIDVLFPLFQRYAIDTFIVGGQTGGLAVFGVSYAALVILQALLVIRFTRACMRVEMNFGRDLRRAQFVHLQELSLSFYNVTPVGYLLARTMNDTGRIATLIGWNVSDLLWAILYMAGSYIAMLFLNWKLAVLVLLVVPVIVLLTGYFQNRILKWNRRVRKLNSRITGAFNEGITGAKTSKTLVIEEQNAASFQDLTGEMERAGVRSARLSAIYVPLILFLSTLATALVLVRGGFLEREGLLLLGTLSAFFSYATGLFEPIQQTARNLSEFISLQASLERVLGLLEEEPQVTDAPEVTKAYGDAFHPRPENWPSIHGDVTFEDVSFRYPDGTEDVLSHFDLHIPAGTTVAIVGETGAGKSTLVNLACRFFEPTGGRVLIDGVDYRERSQLWLHSSLGYVLQTPHLFSGTVMENIRYGRLDATDEEVYAAARAVSADTVVEKLEQGYDTQVGEGGDRLSTGEKQLISFARAVLADPRIFVLDEATSSIDTETEQLIQKATARLLEGRTSFLIAHRLSTIRQADLILVVKGGKIVEQGTHRDLLAKKGYYHDLYARQFAEEAGK